MRNSAGSSGPARPSTASADTMKLRQICAGSRAAADFLPSGLVVVAADPDADHQIAGKADEQGVAIVLGGAGLAEGRDGERRAAPVPLLAAA